MVERRIVTKTDTDIYNCNGLLVQFHAEQIPGFREQLLKKNVGIYANMNIETCQRKNISRIIAKLCTQISDEERTG